MPVSHEDHGGVPVTVAIVLRGLDELFDLALGQVLSAAKLTVWPAPRGDCSFFGGWRHQLQVRFDHRLSPARSRDCAYKTHYRGSMQSDCGQLWRFRNRSLT